MVTKAAAAGCTQRVGTPRVPEPGPVNRTHLYGGAACLSGSHERTFGFAWFWHLLKYMEKHHYGTSNTVTW